MMTAGAPVKTAGGRGDLSTKPGTDLHGPAHSQLFYQDGTPYLGQQQQQQPQPQQQHQQHQQQQQQQHHTSAPPPGFQTLPVGGVRGGALQDASHTLQTGLASAGLSTASLGLLGGEVGSLFTANTTAQGMPDQDWLHNLKLMSDSNKRTRSSYKLRPDAHIDVDKKHDDMSFQELSNGMNEVMEYIY